jgi:phenylpyruvate tautomerase PptA (4-oxalocrotonate tautomerase family)
LNKEQRAQVVSLITAIHAEEALAPRYLVQVLFQELNDGCHFIAGELAPPGQMWIRGDIRSGRTAAQKHKILMRLLQSVSKVINVAEEEVWVYLSDIPASNIAEFGKVLPEPGEEEAWVNALPQPLRDRLIALGKAR